MISIYLIIDTSIFYMIVVYLGYLVFPTLLLLFFKRTMHWDYSEFLFWSSVAMLDQLQLQLQVPPFPR